MSNPTRFGLPFLALMFLFLTGSTALGQATATQAERANLEVQLHLILATNEPADKNLPPSLEGVVRQLKSTVPFTNFRLTTTFTNRIKSGGTLESKGVVSSEVVSPIAGNPVFYEFTVSQIKLTGEGDSQSIDIAKLRFGMRVPVVSGMNRAEGNAPATPIINYEPTGLVTELNLKEGTPTVFGTMTTNKPSQLLVLVITVRRVQ